MVEFRKGIIKCIVAHLFNYLLLIVKQIYDEGYRGLLLIVVD